MGPDCFVLVVHAVRSEYSYSLSSQSTVTLSSQSMAILSGQSTFTLSGQSTVALSGQSTIALSGQSAVALSGQSAVTLCQVRVQLLLYSIWKHQLEWVEVAGISSQLCVSVCASWSAVSEWGDACSHQCQGWLHGGVRVLQCAHITQLCRWRTRDIGLDPWWYCTRHSLLPGIILL